ncbi:MAG: hypothetical protein ACLSHC_01480 [Bilophila wadsworthia]
MGEDLRRVLNGLGDPIDGGPPLKPRTHYPVYADPRTPCPQDHRQADFSGPARARRGAYLRRGAAHGYFRGGWRR